MSASNDFETNILKLVYQNVDYANVGDAGGLRGSATAGSLYISLHTGDPGEAGDQTTNECAYTSYGRVAVARSVAGFTVSGDTVSNAGVLSWPQCTGGTETATHFSVGTASSGAGILMFSGALTASINISNLITPTAAIGAVTNVAS